MLQIWMLLSSQKKQNIFMGHKESIHLRCESLSLAGKFKNGLVNSRKEFTEEKKE